MSRIDIADCRLSSAAVMDRCSGRAGIRGRRNGRWAASCGEPRLDNSTLDPPNPRLGSLDRGRRRRGHKGPSTTPIHRRACRRAPMNLVPCQQPRAAARRHCRRTKQSNRGSRSAAQSYPHGTRVATPPRWEADIRRLHDFKRRPSHRRPVCHEEPTRRRDRHPRSRRRRQVSTRIVATVHCRSRPPLATRLRPAVGAASRGVLGVCPVTAFQSSTVTTVDAISNGSIVTIHSLPLRRSTTITSSAPPGGTRSKEPHTRPILPDRRDLPSASS